MYSMHWLQIGCHKDAFAICMELGVLQTIDIALRAGNGIHRPTIVDSYSSHDKENETMPFTLYCA